jgi:hypothetical protein
MWLHQQLAEINRKLWVLISGLDVGGVEERKRFDRIDEKLKSISGGTTANFNELIDIAKRVDKVQDDMLSKADLEEAVTVISTALNTLIEIDRQNNVLLQQLLNGPPTGEAVRFRITLNIEGANNMAPAQNDATIDLQFDDKTGHASGLLTPVDSDVKDTNLPAGASTPVWDVVDASDSPVTNVVTLTPSVNGMACDVQPATPPIDGVGYKLRAISTLADGTTQLKGESNPFDVVHTPGAAVAFRIVMSSVPPAAAAPTA